MKYAVMVPFGNEDYIYVTEPDGEMFEVIPVLHNTVEAAEQAASIWGKFAKIVEYKEEQNEG